jgi:hypothetical protein
MVPMSQYNTEVGSRKAQLSGKYKISSIEGPMITDDWRHLGIKKLVDVGLFGGFDPTNEHLTSKVRPGLATEPL